MHIRTIFTSSGIRRIAAAAGVAALLACPALALAQDQGMYGNFRVGKYFSPDPQTATGIGGAGSESRRASVYGSGCSGTIDGSPDHLITVTSTLGLRVRVSSNFDSTLVVHGPGGTYCDDDSAGNLDARINATLTPGTYEVYVGAIGEGGSYTLTLSENL